MLDSELDRFKRDIHLVQYVIERYGYLRDRRESSRLSHVLREVSTDDKIVIRLGAGGHWTYFSIRDSGDNGTIIDFVQRRTRCGLGEVRRELRGWLGVARARFEIGVPVAPNACPPRDRGSAADRFAAARCADNSLYLNSRGIRPETLLDPRFDTTWRVDNRDRVLFAHRDASGALTGFEVKHRGFTGFASGGRKAVWQSAAAPDDRALIIAESAIDALSHHQLHRARATRYLSTAGTLSQLQQVTIGVLVAQLRPGSVVVAAVDADDAGTRLTDQLEAIALLHPHVLFVRDCPPSDVGKDWNEVLQHIERDYIASLPAAVRRLAQGSRA